MLAWVDMAVELMTRAGILETVVNTVVEQVIVVAILVVSVDTLVTSTMLAGMLVTAVDIPAELVSERESVVANIVGNIS